MSEIICLRVFYHLGLFEDIVAKEVWQDIAELTMRALENTEKSCSKMESMLSILS